MLAWVDDEVPAIVERLCRRRQGAVLQHDRQRRRARPVPCTSFVPLVSRLVAYLSAGGVRGGSQVGEVILLPLADWKAGETVTVRGPDGKTLSPDVIPGRCRTLYASMKLPTRASTGWNGGAAAPGALPLCRRRPGR